MIVSDSTKIEYSAGETNITNVMSIYTCYRITWLSLDNPHNSDMRETGWDKMYNNSNHRPSCKNQFGFKIA
jgi:hypothetical protein